MRLQRDDVLTDHWYVRPGWTPTSRYLTWHLLPDRAPALHAVVESHHRALAGIDGLDLVPVPWLHLTVQGVGFAGRLDGATRDAVVAATSAGLAGMPAVDLTFGAAGVHGQGVVLPAMPGQPVAALRGVLRAAIGSVRGPEAVDGDDDDPVRPHVSLAYANGEVAAARVLDAVESVRAAPVRVRFDSVSLLELRREGHLYCWRRLADVPFGGTAPADVD